MISFDVVIPFRSSTNVESSIEKSSVTRSIARRTLPLSEKYPILFLSGLKDDVMVVVRLTFEVCGVVSLADSEGSEKREVSAPPIGSGLCGVSSKPREARKPRIHLQRCPGSGMPTEL